MWEMQTASSCFVFIIIIYFVTCKDVCKITRVEHGDVLVEELIPLTNSSGHEIGTQAIYLQVDMSSEDRESDLYIRCRGPYRFQGDRMRVLAKVTCISGRWVPFPVCLLPPCQKKSLNYRGLERGGQKVLFHGESFLPTCQHGYKVTENVDKRIHCQNGQWIGNLPPCVNVSEVQCKVPEKPDFGSMQLSGNIATVGSTVTFRCDTSHKLVGSAVSTCNRLGEWTSRTPKCVAVCKTEALLDFEGLLLKSRRTSDDGESFQPRCDEGFNVSSKNDSKIYCRDGKWEGNIPPCSPAQNKAPCDSQLLSNFEGLLVEISHPLNNGDWFQPKCDDGFEAANKNDSKIYCRDGNWDGNVPPCAPVDKIKSCTIPNVNHGDFGKYEEDDAHIFRGIKTFVKVPAGATLDEKEQVILQCNDYYVAKSQPLKEVTITCQEGQLSPEPACVTTPCLDDPPPIQNGQTVIISGNHRHVILEP